MVKKSNVLFMFVYFSVCLFVVAWLLQDTDYQYLSRIYSIFFFPLYILVSSFGALLKLGGSNSWCESLKKMEELRV